MVQVRVKVGAWEAGEGEAQAQMGDSRSPRGGKREGPEHSGFRAGDRMKNFIPGDGTPEGNGVERENDELSWEDVAFEGPTGHVQQATQ